MLIKSTKMGQFKIELVHYVDDAFLFDVKRAVFQLKTYSVSECVIVV
jgi:hypothetical protein